jgi:MbtH protein
MYDEDDDTRTYDVVMNHEEQYSIWLKGKAIPDGWTAVGKSGLKPECLAYIEEVWTDMRPLSLRKHMESFASSERVVRVPPPAEDVARHSVDTPEKATELT